MTWPGPPIDATHGPATSYNLRYSPPSEETSTTITGVKSPYTLSGLAAGTMVRVQVQGVNEHGDSPWSPHSVAVTVAGES